MLYIFLLIYDDLCIVFFGKQYADDIRLVYFAHTILWNLVDDFEYRRHGVARKSFFCELAHLRQNQL